MKLNEKDCRVVVGFLKMAPVKNTPPPMMLRGAVGGEYVLKGEGAGPGRDD